MVEKWGASMKYCVQYSDVKVRILIGHSLHTLVLTVLFRIYHFSKVWIRWGVKELYLLYTIGSIDGIMHAYSEETLRGLQRVTINTYIDIVVEIIVLS